MLLVAAVIAFLIYRKYRKESILLDISPFQTSQAFVQITMRLLLLFQTVSVNFQFQVKPFNNHYPMAWHPVLLYETSHSVTAGISSSHVKLEGRKFTSSQIVGLETRSSFYKNIQIILTELFMKACVSEQINNLLLV